MEEKPSIATLMADTKSSPVKTSSIIDSKSALVSTDPNANIGKVLYIGVSFFILFTAFTGAQTLVSEIYDQLGYSGLGKLNLLVLYAVFAVAAFFVPGLIKTWSYKNGVFIGAVGKLFSMVVGALTTLCKTSPECFWCQHSSVIYTMNLVCYAITGFCGPILWLSSSSYVTGCTNETNKGKYFGIFNAFVFAAGVAGSLLAAVLIGGFGQFSFYLVVCALNLLAVIMIFFAPHVPKYSEEGSEDTVLEKTVKMLKLASTKRMKPFLVYVFFVGLLLAIYDSFEYEVIISTIEDKSINEQDSTSAMVFMVEGIMTIIASYAAGKLADIVRRKTVLNFFNIFAILAIITSFLSYYTQSLVLAYVMASCWGIAYSGGFTLIWIVIAKDFEGSVEGLGILQFMPNGATALGLGFCLAVTDIPLFLYITAAILMITIICTCIYKQKKDCVIPKSEDMRELV